MQRLTMAEQTLWSDLKQRSLDAMFDSQFPENGNFTTRTYRGRPFIYYVGYHTAAGGERASKQFSKYVGPADDPDIEAVVRNFSRAKSGYRERRNLVSALKGLGLPTPPSMVGEVVEGLWRAGVFRLRAVLVGTSAFQTYAGSMGVRLPMAPTMTGDVDVAQHRSVSMLIDDRTDPLLNALRSVDPTFGCVAHPFHRTKTMAFSNEKGFKVEFLAPNRGSDDAAMEPTNLPALGLSAYPMRFLDYVIRDPHRSVLLHKAGVPVVVPSPERFAVHKMIVATRRPPEWSDKARKDLDQARILFEAARENGDLVDFGHAFLEAWDRGPSWRAALSVAERSMPTASKATVVEARRLAFEESGVDQTSSEAEVSAAVGAKRPKPRGSATRPAGAVGIAKGRRRSD